MCVNNTFFIWMDGSELPSKKFQLIVKICFSVTTKYSELNWYMNGDESFIIILRESNLHFMSISLVGHLGYR